MSLFKGSLAAIMAAKAEGSFRLHQKVFLVRTMRSVARCATFCPYFMDNFLLIILLLMALKASFIPFCLQKVTPLGGMGIVA
jgi:hypothetical protein